MTPPRCRVILLLDLDCFYAQCERVRMGLGLEASVALMQVSTYEATWLRFDISASQLLRSSTYHCITVEFSPGRFLSST